MIFLTWILDGLFFTFCGWIGHVVVRVLSGGRIYLEWGEGSESVIAEWLGVFILCLGGVLFAWWSRFVT